VHKLAVTFAPAARYGSVRFVSGYLDWIGSRAESRFRAKGGRADGCDQRELDKAPTRRHVRSVSDRD
jgi:hypothetical protein